jgi:thiamine-monophosphate kinase
MIELAEKHDVEIAGGDTCKSPVLSITITVFGIGQENHLLRRSTARAGDVVAVTGIVGSAAAGLDMLRNKLKFDQEEEDSLKNAFLRPQPRVAEGQLAIKHGVAAGIDISDGLLADLGHICTESGVGARIDIDQLPIHQAVRENFGDRAVELALTGGEDYELLLTAPAGSVDNLKQEASCPVTIIGEIVAGKPDEIALVDKSGKPFRINGAGWEHFRTA